MIDIQKFVDELWAAPHPPTVKPHGRKCLLVHPFGHSVAFDLKRSDLRLAPAEFASRVMAEPLAQLRAMVAT